MPKNATFGTRQLIIRAAPSASIWDIPGIVILWYFGWIAVSEESWLFKLSGMGPLLFGTVSALALLFRFHRRIELYEHGLFLYNSYPMPSSDPDRIQLDQLAAVRLTETYVGLQPTAQPDGQYFFQEAEYGFTFERRDGTAREFTLKLGGSNDTGAVTQLVERLAERGVQIHRDSPSLSQQLVSLAQTTEPSAE